MGSPFQSRAQEAPERPRLPIHENPIPGGQEDGQARQVQRGTTER